MNDKVIYLFEVFYKNDFKDFINLNYFIYFVSFIYKIAFYKFKKKIIFLN